MNNPVLVEVIRGGLVESRHRGAVAVADAGGALVFGVGDVAAAVFPRSAVKALQALPLVESGAAERYGLGDEELALACASHSGERAHVEGVTRMLAKAGFEPSALCCGAHWPLSQAAAYALARTGAPSALHNNCSGKHAGFLAVARARGVEHSGYWQPDHAVQREVHGVLQDLTGAVLSPDRRAIDGCSVPTWAGRGLSSDRALAAARLRAACTHQPWYVAGTGRFGTEIVRLLGERIFLKTGAEGVACGALPTLGLGISIKCDDGAGRAAEAVAAALIARLLPLTDAERHALALFAQPTVRNWNGTEFGALRVTEALAQSG